MFQRSWLNARHMYCHRLRLGAAVTARGGCTAVKSPPSRANSASDPGNYPITGDCNDQEYWNLHPGERGYRVTIVQNPLTSLADDVAATQRALDRQDGPTILVGHSWGGVVITEAGTHSNVIGLVYVSALSPDAGETTGQQYQGFAATPEFVIETQKDGFGLLSPTKFKAGFAHDASDADAAFMRDSQVPINMSVFETKLKNAAWRTKPSWAVIATEDKAFDQAMLLSMAKRIAADVTKVSASHAVFMTQPKVVADTIDRAAKEAGVNAKQH